MRLIYFIVAIFIAITPIIARTEILQGISYIDTLGEVRQKYPNARFEIVKPAWLKLDETFYRITGSGIPGAIMILFNDGRPDFKKMLTENAENPNYDKDGVIKLLATQQDNEALNAIWVRWIPTQAIPLDRYKQKYGQPKCSLDDAMRPICTWPAVGLEAQMSDDQKLVEFVTTVFTKSEKQAQAIKKKGSIPDYLK
jgi:hypothetical protein